MCKKKKKFLGWLAGVATISLDDAIVDRDAMMVPIGKEKWAGRKHLPKIFPLFLK